MTTAKDQSATTNQTDTTTTNTTATTTSGDTKGDQQTITSTDVGDLNAVLGATGATAATEQKPAETTSVTTTQRAEVKQPIVNSKPPVQPTKPSSPPPAPIAAKTVQAGVTVTDTAPVADEQLPEVLEALKVGKMQTNAAVLDLLSYVADMHPGKPQGAASIEANQVKLLNALYTIVISEDTNFGTVFKAVIAIVRRHRNDCFRVTMRNRGLNGVSMATIDNKNMRFLTRLVDAVVVASGLKDMSAVKQHVDMKKLFEAISNVRAKQNLTAFFS
jgi:hypothetical protein